MAVLQIRVTEEQKAVIEALANGRDVSVSEYVRGRALDLERVSEPKAPPLEVVGLTRSELRNLVDMAVERALAAMRAPDVFDRMAAGEEFTHGKGQVVKYDLVPTAKPAIPESTAALIAKAEALQAQIDAAKAKETRVDTEDDCNRCGCPKGSLWTPQCRWPYKGRCRCHTGGQA